MDDNQNDNDQGQNMQTGDMGTQGQMVNPIQVEKFLQGVDYPASKEELIQKAREKGADENVIKTLQRMPGQQFNSPNDVSEAIGKIE